MSTTIAPFPWESAPLPAQSEIRLVDRVSPQTRAVMVRAFGGKYTRDDVEYIARAILQLSDENHEIRQENREIRSRLDALEGGVKG